MRKLSVEAADNGLLAPELAAGIARVKGAKSIGVRVGNWLSLREAQALLNAPDVAIKKGLRDRAMFAVLLGCGGGIDSSPAVANGVVYVGSNDGSLYAFALPTPAAATFAPPERPEPATLRPDLKLILQH